MKTPTTLDIRSACRTATSAVRGQQTYTDKLTEGRSKVSYLMYSCSEEAVNGYAERANEILNERGFESVVTSYRSMTCWGGSYMKLTGVGTRA